ncbi:MAG TPA: response regulator transcription factor [Bacteriovoracaceae bacterium]|nr:response regulator transcription factor [Bacteriovoracaceae bacterium]
MTTILIVDDEKKMSAFIQQGFEEVGYKVVSVESVPLAREAMKNNKFDLMILDGMLPEISGMEFARELRLSGHQGLILMLTALATTKDKITGLDAGADDYLTKPFEFEELMARARALIRRKSDDKALLENGALVMDLIGRVVTREGTKIELTTKEFSLLEFFMRHVAQTVDRDAIARQVWGTEFDPDSNVIDVYINHLRKKIDHPFTKKLLKTVVGQGYVFHRFE